MFGCFTFCYKMLEDFLDLCPLGGTQWKQTSCNSGNLSPVDQYSNLRKGFNVFLPVSPFLSNGELYLICRHFLARARKFRPRT